MSISKFSFILILSVVFSSCAFTPKQPVQIVCTGEEEVSQPQVDPLEEMGEEKFLDEVGSVYAFMVVPWKGVLAFKFNRSLYQFATSGAGGHKVIVAPESTGDPDTFQIDSRTQIIFTKGSYDITVCFALPGGKHCEELKYVRGLNNSRAYFVSLRKEELDSNVKKLLGDMLLSIAFPGVADKTKDPYPTRDWYRR